MERPDRSISPFVTAFQKKIADGAEESSSMLNVLRKSVLSGGFSLVKDATVWSNLTWKLTLFVSSSQYDTEQERNILVNEIFPELRQEGIRHGVLLDLIDMNFESDDDLDPQIWRDHVREIEKCRRESCGPFFISLLSDK